MARLRICKLVGLAILAAVALASQVEAAAPRFVIVHGGSLPHTIALSDWAENGRLFASISSESSSSPASLESRPYFGLAFFWGPQWEVYLADGKDTEDLRPDQANQHGRFYPAYQGSEAVAVISNMAGPHVRRVDQTGLDILTSHGIPIAVDPASSPAGWFLRLPKAWQIGSAVFLVAAVILIIRLIVARSRR